MYGWTFREISELSLQQLEAYYEQAAKFATQQQLFSAFGEATGTAPQQHAPDATNAFVAAKRRLSERTGIETVKIQDVFKEMSRGARARS